MTLLKPSRPHHLSAPTSSTVLYGTRWPNLRARTWPWSKHPGSLSRLRIPRTPSIEIHCNFPPHRKSWTAPWSRPPDSHSTLWLCRYCFKRTAGQWMNSLTEFWSDYAHNLESRYRNFLWCLSKRELWKNYLFQLSQHNQPDISWLQKRSMNFRLIEKTL